MCLSQRLGHRQKDFDFCKIDNKLIIVFSISAMFYMLHTVLGLASNATLQLDIGFNIGITYYGINFENT